MGSMLPYIAAPWIRHGGWQPNFIQKSRALNGKTISSLKGGCFGLFFIYFVMRRDVGHPWALGWNKGLPIPTRWCPSLEMPHEDHRKP
jgi:hypothetical protein